MDTVDTLFGLWQGLERDQHPPLPRGASHNAVSQRCGGMGRSTDALATQRTYTSATMTANALASHIVAGVLSVALALSPRMAFAADVTWAETFDTPAVAAHVAPNGGSVLLVSTGPRSNARREVVRALQEELEGSGVAGLVRTHEVSTQDVELDDAGLLRDLNPNADRVAIIRVANDRATVSVYTSEGVAVGGFSASRGESITPPAETSHVGGSVLAVLDDAPELDDDALAEYERKRVVFGGSLQVTATGTNSAVVSQSFEPRTGGGAPLRGAEFYAYVGRDDLAKEYRRRKAARTGLLATGSLAALSGLVVMVTVPLVAIAREDPCTSSSDPVETEMCESDAESERKQGVRRGLGIGGGLLAGGIVLSIVGGKLRPHKATPAEVQEMGETYNRELRQRLGIRDVAVRANADRNGGGVVLTGRF